VLNKLTNSGQEVAVANTTLLNIINGGTTLKQARVINQVRCSCPVSVHVRMHHFIDLVIPNVRCPARREFFISEGLTRCNDLIDFVNSSLNSFIFTSSVSLVFHIFDNAVIFMVNFFGRTLSPVSIAHNKADTRIDIDASVLAD